MNKSVPEVTHTKKTKMWCFTSLIGHCYCRSGNTHCDCMDYKAELLD